MVQTYTSIEIAQSLIALFLSSCMIQSGLDKVFDWKGNNEFLKSHFSKTFLSGMVPMMLFIVTLLELIGGVICLVGAVIGIITFDTTLIGIGFFVIAVDLIALFFGHRIAKDYQGAATLVGYFILSILGIITFGL